MTIQDLFSIVRDGGIIGVLVLIIYGGYKRWWVWGWLYNAAEKELVMWRELALKGTNLAEKLAAIGDKDGTSK